MSHSVVIGGAGFVGSWVVEKILKSPGNQVTVIDNLLSSEKWNLTNDLRLTFIEGSAASFSTFEQIKGPVDYVYQLSCFHGNQSSIARPLDDFDNSLKTTLVTLEWVKNNCPSARVVYSGAGCAVAEKTWDSPTPVEEVDITSLLHDSPYSISKITGEMYCNFYVKVFGLNVVRVRFQNVYGPREILGAGVWRGTENTIWRNVIPTFVWKAIHGEEIELFGNATRDFVYVEDVAEGVILAAENGATGEVYNIATGTETSIQYIANLILGLVNSNSNLVIKPRRNWDRSGRRLGNTQKSRVEIGFEARVSLDEGIRKTIDWTLQNLNSIANSIAKHL